MITIYINPDFTGVSDGSIEAPYKTWEEAGPFYLSDMTYLQKRGTETTLTKMLKIGNNYEVATPNNIYLGAYGEGELPIIHPQPNSQDDIISLTICDNITVENLQLIGNINYGGLTTVACISPSGFWASGSPEDPIYGCTNILIKNCVLASAYNPVRILPYETYVDGVKIENCEIFDATEDGAFIKNGKNVEIANCNIHHVNQSYHAGLDSGGDGIQYTYDCPGAYVHDCIIDRSDTPKKFCVIWNDAGLGTTSPIRIEDNILTSPQPQDGGACIYLKGGLGHTIKGNTFQTNDVDGGLNGIWCHTPAMKIHSNVFNGNSQGITIFDVSGYDDNEIYNNTFNMVGDGPVYNSSGVIISNGGGSKVKNNIFKLATGINPLHGTALDSSNNCFSETNANIGTTDIIADPMFVDEANNNFKLNENSQCINSGTDVGLQFDKDGNSIIGIPDMGAYEFQDSTITIPSCPVKISPLNNASGTEQIVTLKWNSVYNAIGYKLTLDDVEFHLTGTTEFTTEILEFESIHTWSVIAYNSIGESVNCVNWTFSVKAENVSVNYIDLVWNLDETAVGYKISLGTDNPPTNVENLLDVGNTDTYRFENPEYLTTYYWQIIPYNEGGDAENCPIWSFTTEDDGTILPPNPTTPVYPPDGATDVPITTA